MRVWVLCLYFLGLNLSNEQIARELDLDPDDAQRMCTQLRQGTVKHKPQVVLSGEVECDEVYVVAGHKGHPKAVQKKQRLGRRRRLKGERGRGTLEKEKPPILGMIQRTGEVVIRMLENVQQATIDPIIRATIRPGAWFTPMNMTSTAGCRSGVTCITRSAMQPANSPGTRTAMGFARFT